MMGNIGFSVIDGKYIKLEFRKEFKKFNPQFLRILSWSQKIRIFIFFSEIRKDFKKNLELHFQNKISIFEKKDEFFFDLTNFWNFRFFFWFLK